MATRQYIGARYVPKIVGEWSDSIPYEALSIVTRFGNSYTSKKPVPIGIDITNTEYWILTGNYNEQVEAYRKDVSEYKELFDKYAKPIENKNIGLPESYGAIGDGNTDDTNALQTCINENNCVLLSGKYKISSTISVGTGKKIYGIGDGSVVTNLDIVMFTAYDTYNVVFDSVKMKKPCGSNYHIEMSGTFPTVINCVLDGTNLTNSNFISGIKIIKSSTMNNFECCIKNNFISVGQINVSDNTDGYIEGNVVWASAVNVTPPTYAIVLNSSSYSLSDNQVVPGSLGGIKVTSSATPSMNILNNFFDGSYDSVLSGTLLEINNIPQNCIVAHNKFYSGYKNAITLNSCNNVIINENIFINNNRSKNNDAEIIINGEYSRHEICNNQFSYYGDATYGIVKVNNPKGCAIIFDNNLGAGGYTVPNNYINAPAFSSNNNLINGVKFFKVCGTCSQIGSTYGVPFYSELNSANLSVEKCSVNGETSSVYSLEYKGEGSYAIVRGDSADVGKVVTAYIRATV